MYDTHKPLVKQSDSVNHVDREVSYRFILIDASVFTSMGHSSYSFK